MVNIDAGYMLAYNGEITLVKGKHQFNTGDITELCAALRHRPAFLDNMYTIPATIARCSILGGFASRKVRTP